MDVDPGKKVYIGNLDQHVTPQELQDMFQKFGTIQGVWVARSPPGFAFVTFEDKRDAEDATRELDGAQISGRRIRVEIARGSRGGGRDEKRGGGGSFNGRRMRGGRSRSRSGDRGPRRRSPSYGRGAPREYDRDYERDRSRDHDRGEPRERRRRDASRSRSRVRSPYRRSAS